jgi:hypothetical protein
MAGGEFVSGAQQSNILFVAAVKKRSNELSSVLLSVE